MRMSVRPWLILAFGALLSSAAKAQLPSLSIQDAAVIEGDIGTTNADFIVNVSAASSSTITVNYTTMDGSATVADNDYQARSGTLIIFAGQTTGTISVPVVGDTKPEQNETFTVVLSSPTNATIARGTATGTILNDDGATPTNTPSFTPTLTPTRTPSPSTTPTPTVTFTRTPTSTPTQVTPSATATDTATPTPSRTVTQTPVGPTATPVARAPVIPPRGRTRLPSVVPIRTPV